MKFSLKVLYILIIVVIFSGFVAWEPIKAGVAKILYVPPKGDLVFYANFDSSAANATSTPDFMENDLSNTVSPCSLFGDGASDVLQNLHTSSSTAFAGRVNEGLLLDGSDDYASCGNPANLTGSFSVAAWVNLQNKGVSGTISAFVSKYFSGVPRPFSLHYINTGDRFDCQYNLDSLTTFDAPSTNRWYFLVCIYDASNTTLYLYVDGVLRSQLGGLTTISSDGRNLTIGARDDGGASSFAHVLIDDVRLYTRALNTTEIDRLYRNGFGVKKVVTGNPNKNGLVGYWNFDGNTTITTAADLSGNGNNGTMTNVGAAGENMHTASSTGFTGKIGGAALFDGGDDRIDIGNPASLRMTSAITLSAWVQKLGSSGGNPGIIERTGNPYTDSDTDVALVCNADCTNVSFGIYNPSAVLIVSIATTFDIGWIHLTGTYDGTTGILYKNGVEVGRTSVTDTIKLEGTPEWFLGSYRNSRIFSGLIDEVRVYDRGLSATEVAALYNSTARKFSKSPTKNGLVGYWNFDGVASTSVGVPDLSSNANNGTGYGDNSGGTQNLQTASSTAFTGKVNGGALFDGDDDLMRVSNPGGLPTGSSARTLMAWIRPDNCDPGGPILHYGNGAAAGDEHIILCITVAGTTYLFTDGVDDNVTISGSEIPASNQWSHVAFVNNALGSWTYYLNGVLVKSGVFTISTASPTILNIGDRTDSAQTNFPGLIDEVRIYDRALSATEIEAIYLSGH